MGKPVTAVSQYLTRSHGQGKINLELLLRLHQRGRRVEAVATWLDSAAVDLDGFRWQRIRVSRKIPTHWLRCELFRNQAERRLRRGGQVAVNNGAAAVVPARINIAMFVHTAWLASAWHPRHAGTLHGRYLAAFNAQQSRLEKRAFARADHVVALSDGVRRELIEHCQLPEDRVVTIPPGVDAGLFRPRTADAPNPLREACGLTARDDRPLLLFVGEIRSSRKNLDLVLRGMARRPEVLLAVAGDAAGSRYPALAGELGVAERTFFLGHRHDVPQLMAGADAFVFPTHYEPFGLVVTEAMACGLPVVTTRQAGAACVVEHQRHGWLLEDGDDSEGLDTALLELLDPTIRAAWGGAARERAVTLSWDRMADQYEALL